MEGRPGVASDIQVKDEDRKVKDKDRNTRLKPRARDSPASVQ